MEQKLISVVVATHNCGHKLAMTIESVLSQPGELHELIVVDGGSTDGTVELVETYGGSFPFVSEADQGVYDAFNKGIRMASGRYIIFLGAGDSLREGVLDRVARFLPEDNSAFVYGNAYLVRHDKYYAGEFTPQDFTRRNLCQQAIFYGRTIFTILGQFDLKYRVYADHAFNMRCFADSRFRKIYLDMVVADFEGGGISDTQEDPVFQRDWPRLIRKYVGLNEYIYRRIYLARVAFYIFRHKLADSIKAAAAPAAAVAPKVCEVEEETNSGR